MCGTVQDVTENVEIASSLFPAPTAGAHPTFFLCGGGGGEGRILGIYIICFFLKIML
jgi:hypothetical protein